MSELAEIYKKLRKLNEVACCISSSVSSLDNKNPTLTPISKTVALTLGLVALPSLPASYITLINNENTLSLVINGGDEITLLEGQVQDIPYITNTNQIQVKGTGTLSYIVYTP